MDYIKFPNSIKPFKNNNKTPGPRPGTLLRAKLIALKSATRNSWLKFCGLQINSGVKLGKINCLWLTSIFIDNNATIEDNVTFKINKPFDSNNFIQIGKRAFIGRDCEFNCTSTIIVGDDVLIASGCTIVDNGHAFDGEGPMNTQACTVAEIHIEDDVWIGAQCLVLQGCTIGTGAVIAAGSVVNKSIPSFEIWGGVPARFIKKRSFAKDQMAMNGHHITAGTLL